MQYTVSTLINSLCCAQDYINKDHPLQLVLNIGSLLHQSNVEVIAKVHFLIDVLGPVECTFVLH